MLTTHSIDSLESPLLQPYKTLRRPEEHLTQGIFVTEGEKGVRRLLESHLEMVSMLVTPEWFELYQRLISTRTEHPFDVFVAERPLVETIVGFRLHQGIMAVAKVPETLPLEETLNQLRSPFVLVALDSIANAENMGVIVRNCSGLGVQHILIGETSCSPYLRRAVRNSMGTIFKMNIIQSHDLVSDLKLLSTQHNLNIIAAHPQEGSKNIQDISMRGSVCMVFGSEGEGISPRVLSVCNEKVIIPMHNETDSLNVASSVAILLWEIQRKRRNHYQ